MTGPVWTVPLELVRATATPNSTLVLTQLVNRQAALAPHAQVELTGAGFVAIVDFEEPRLPGLRQQKRLQLGVGAQENVGVAA